MTESDFERYLGELSEEEVTDIVESLKGCAKVLGEFRDPWRQLVVYRLLLMLATLLPCALVAWITWLASGMLPVDDTMGQGILFTVASVGAFLLWLPMRNEFAMVRERQERLRQDVVAAAAPYVKRLKLAGRLLRSSSLQEQWRERLGKALAGAEKAFVVAGGGVRELRRAEQLMASRQAA